jgi:hypothetical protein
MRTTVDLPDDLLRKVKAHAALQGTTLKDLLTRYVEQGLRRSSQVSPEPARRSRSELPVARPATGRSLPALSNAELFSVLDAEETAGGRAH